MSGQLCEVSVSKEKNCDISTHCSTPAVNPRIPDLEREEGPILEVSSHYVARIKAHACVGQWSLSDDLALQRETGFSQISLSLNWENYCLENWTIERKGFVSLYLSLVNYKYWLKIYIYIFQLLFTFFLYSYVKENMRAYEHFFGYYLIF